MPKKKLLDFRYIVSKISLYCNILLFYQQIKKYIVQFLYCNWTWKLLLETDTVASCCWSFEKNLKVFYWNFLQTKNAVICGPNSVIFGQNSANFFVTTSWFVSFFGQESDYLSRFCITHLTKSSFNFRTFIHPKWHHQKQIKITGELKEFF